MGTANASLRPREQSGKVSVNFRKGHAGPGIIKRATDWGVDGDEMCGGCGRNSVKAKNRHAEKEQFEPLLQISFACRKCFESRRSRLCPKS
jgi:hypothetical protein